MLFFSMNNRTRVKNRNSNLHTPNNINQNILARPEEREYTAKCKYFTRPYMLFVNNVCACVCVRDD